MKTCSACKRRRRRSSFSPNARHGDGLQSRCKDCVNAANRASWKGHKNQDRKDIVRRHKYKIEPDDYESMLRSQGHGCAICGKKNDLAVDHDHETGQVRGILCRPCNSAIGFLKDDPALVAKAVAYLLQSRNPVESAVI